MDHKKYRDAHFKRVRYWTKGGKDKFEEKASKEEKEWLEAVQKGTSNIAIMRFDILMEIRNLSKEGA